MVKISVVMPVYNTCEKYFRIAIKSILNQTFKDFEFIIVDNGSKKYVSNIIKCYKDNRIKNYRINKNKGPAYARNLGIEKSNGKYIAFMDSDDISLPKRLEIQYDFLEKNKDIGCLGTLFFTKGRKGPIARKVFKNDEIVEYLLYRGCVILQSTVMLRKSILVENNIKYNSEYVPAEDYAFWLDLIGKTKFEIIKDKLVIYRYHADNISHIKQNLQQEKSLIVQINTIQRVYNTKIPTNNIVPLFAKKRFELNDIKICETVLTKDILSNKIWNKFFRNKIRKIFYHSHGLKKQWFLFNSSFKDIFNFSLCWRIFVFITRLF